MWASGLLRHALHVYDTTGNASAVLIDGSASNSGFLSFRQAGVEKSYIQYTSNSYLRYFAAGGHNFAQSVGIGTNTLYAGTNVTSLTINATSYPTISLNIGGTVSHVIMGYSTYLNIDAIGNRSIKLRTNDLDRLTISGDGAITAQTDQNNSTIFKVKNATASTSSDAQLRCESSSSLGLITAMPSSYSTSSAYVADSFLVLAASTCSAGLGLAAEGANPINLWTNNTKRMTIDSAGKVGIGTAAPSRPLSVHMSSAGSVANFLHYTDASNFQGLYIDVSQSTDVLTLNNSGSHGGSAIDLQVSSASIMYLQGSGGKVGIGTTAPSQLLHVKKSSNDARILIETTGAGAYLQLNSVTSGYAGIEIYGNSGANWSFGQYGFSDLSVIEGGMNGTRRVTFRAGGNVGIGTVTPSAKLDIVESASYTPPLELNAPHAIVKMVGGNGTGYMGMGNGYFGSQPSGMFFRSDNLPICWGAAGSSVTHMTLLANGKFGIGTTNPTRTLQVAGAAHATSHLVGSLETALGIAGSFPDANDSELGPGYLVMTRDDTAAAKQLQFWKNGSLHSGLMTDTNGLNFVGSDGAADITVKTDGKVGIGTTAPSGAILDIVAGDNSTPQIKLRAIGANTQAKIHASGSSGNFELFTGDGDGNQTIKLSIARTSGAATFSGTVACTTITTSATLSTFADRIKIVNGSAQLNIGQWDTVNHRIEADANRPLMITSYEGNINLGISGNTRLNVHNAGIAATGNITATGKLTVGSSVTATSKAQIHSTQSDTMTDAEAFLALKGGGGDGMLMGQRATTPYGAWIQAGYLPNIGTSHHYPLILQPHGSNVGIGTIAPTGKLNVGYTTDVAPIVYAQGSEGLVINATRHDGSNYRAYVDFLAGRGSDATNGGASMRFFTQPRSSAAPTQALTLQYDGNVGIGTTAPGQKLHVNGNILVNAQILTPGGSNLQLNPNTGLVTVGGALQATSTLTATGATFSGAAHFGGTTEKVYMAGNYLILDGANGTILRDSGSNKIIQNGSYFRPDGNNDMYLGASGNRWANTYSVLGNFSGNITGGSEITTTYAGVALATFGVSNSYGVKLNSSSASYPIKLQNAGNTICTVSSTGLLPGADGTYNLGSTSSQDWKELYIREIDMYNQRLRIYTSAEKVIFRDHSSIGQGITFQHRNTHVMTIGDASGNTRVGIGTTAPAAKLHVYGGGITLANNQILSVGTGASNSSGKVRLYGGSGTAYYMDYQPVGTQDRNFRFNGSSSGSAYTTYFNQQGSGNHNLYVDGDITSAGTGRYIYAVNLNVTGYKNFEIEHPTKENMMLVHSSLEGPEAGVYYRGRAQSDTITLPDYWTGLVRDGTITVQLTPNGSFQHLYVVSTSLSEIKIGAAEGETIDCYYIIYGERADVAPLVVEDAAAWERFQERKSAMSDGKA